MPQSKTDNGAQPFSVKGH